MHSYQHVSYVWPKTTQLVCQAPSVGSEQINLWDRNAEVLQELKLGFSVGVGQGEGLSWEDKASWEIVLYLSQFIMAVSQHVWKEKWE